MGSYVFVIYTLCFSFFPFLMFSQSAESSEDDSCNFEMEIFAVVDQRAMFPGGEDEMFTFIKANSELRIAKIPSKSRNLVLYEVLVLENGRICLYHSLQGADDYKREAERIIKMMPFWAAAMKNGEEVVFQLTIPFYFK